MGFPDPPLEMHQAFTGRPQGVRSGVRTCIFLTFYNTAALKGARGNSRMIAQVSMLVLSTWTTNLKFFRSFVVPHNSNEGPFYGPDVGAQTVTPHSAN